MGRRQHDSGCYASPAPLWGRSQPPACTVGAVAQTAEQFIEHFYGKLAYLSQSARIVQWSSEDELTRLKHRQTIHLRNIMTPGLREIKHRRAASRVWPWHALAGVPFSSVPAAWVGTYSSVRNKRLSIPGQYVMITRSRLASRHGCRWKSKPRRNLRSICARNTGLPPRAWSICSAIRQSGPM